MSQQQRSVSRRDFLKLVGGTTAAVAVASAVPAALDAEGAFALPRAYAAGNLADGTYKVNANLFISKNLVLIKKNAYFTNPTDPNDGNGIPEFPNTEPNAQMTVVGGVATVTVPLINECFMLISAENGSAASIAGTKTKTAEYNDTKGNSLTRITEITFNLADTNGTYELGACEEYAAYKNPPFPMSLLVPGYLYWTATLTVDFSTAVRA